MLALWSYLLRHCIWVFAVSAALKALLISPSTYASTDFDVHRNWLAITWNLPLSRWYHDATSVWTLDYPPAFAFFEWLLSWAAARIVGKAALELTADPIRSWAIIVFQRTSVIISEIPLYVAVCALVAARLRPRSAELQQLTLRGGPLLPATEAWLKRAANGCAAICALVLLHSGLVLVDNVHFQYNGYLLSMLVGGLAAAYAGKPLLAVMLLALLTLHKHLFAVLAPAAVVYLAATAVPGGQPAVSVAAAVAVARRLLIAVALVVALSAAVVLPVLVEDWVGVAGAVTSPYVWWQALANVRLGVGALSASTASDSAIDNRVLHAAEAVLRNGLQLLSRLFPFSRGLVHAYWAPNAWAVYMACDKVVAALCRKLGLPLPLFEGLSSGSQAEELSASVNVSAGAVGHAHLPHAFNSSSFLTALPTPTPFLCGSLTLALLLPALWRLWRGAVSANRHMPQSQSHGSAAAAADDRLFAAARHFHMAIIISYGAAFAFGWHTHEKAALYVALPLLLFAVDPQNASLACAGSSDEHGDCDAIVAGQHHDDASEVDSSKEVGAAKAVLPSNGRGAAAGAVAGAKRGLRRRRGSATASAAHAEPPRPLQPSSLLAQQSSSDTVTQVPEDGTLPLGPLEDDSAGMSALAAIMPSVTESACGMHISASAAVLPLIFTALEVPFVLLHALAYTLWLRQQLPKLTHAHVFWRLILPAGLVCAVLLHTMCLPGTAAVCVRFPFLPLAAVSFTAAAGMLSSFAAAYVAWLTAD